MYEGLLGIHWHTLYTLVYIVYIGIHWHTLAYIVYIGIHWYTYIGMHWYAYIGMHWYTYIGMHWYAYIGMHWYTFRRLLVSCLRSLLEVRRGRGVGVEGGMGSGGGSLGRRK